jgi:threonine/homoserine/homoserine lactone efflux protein
MDFLLKGMTYGVALSFLIGPIFFALLQTGIERGAKVGLSLAFGVWISDYTYIIAIYLGISWISEISELPSFKFLVGGIGSIVLIGFGITTLLNNKLNNNVKVENKVSVKSGYFANFLKGFLINTINPFTVFFWISMSAELITKEATTIDAVIFFSGILGMIMLMDILKVLLAKKISQYLKPKHILIFRKIVGVVMLVGGVILMYRSFI